MRAFPSHKHLQVAVLTVTLVWWNKIAFTADGLSTSSSVVNVQVTQSLSNGVTPSQAKDAWLLYQWKQGGGLPVVVRQEYGDERRLLPIGMQEVLVDTKSDNEICYRVTDMGLFSGDLLHDSHSATVQFVSIGEGPTDMIWNVEFQAKNRADFWKAVTEMNVKAASANLASYLAPPRMYRRTTRLSPTNNNVNLCNEWINFVWKQGGGLPLPPPIQLNDKTRMIVPPFLVERIVSTTDNEIEYTVDNPGLFTYQAYTHAGRVTFQSIPDSKDVDMMWEVQVRPFRGWNVLVESFTSAVITTLARNFKSHINEPDATVKLAPPRGKGEAFGEVSKDSWLGGVLDAHLSDKRSTAEQTLAIFQPWTWGRSSDAEGEAGEWTTGIAAN